MALARHSGLSFSSKQVFLATPWRLATCTGRPASGPQIFLHVPKAGGTSVDHLMSCCAAFEGKSYKRFVVRDAAPPVLIRKGWTGAWSDVAGHPAEALRGIAYMSGHFPFGVHEMVAEGARYVTLIRDPIDREVSSYNFHFQRGFLDGTRSLASMVADGVVLDNPQTRMLAGRDAMSGACDQTTFERAIANLAEHFALVGVTERAHEFVRALISLNGWPGVVYPRAQVTGVKLIERPDPALAASLAEYHRHDVRLHRLAADRWQKWIGDTVLEPAPDAPADPVIVIPRDFQATGKAEVVRRDRIKVADEAAG